MKRFVVGDIHGNIKALKQAVHRAGIDKEIDEVIFLGDYCDGWGYTVEVVDELLTFKNAVFIMGNHDEWMIKHMMYGQLDHMWVSQGGQATLDSYRKKEHLGKLIDHRNFWNYSNLKNYHIDIDTNTLFVHGGINFRESIINQEYTSNYSWDRSLWNHMEGLYITSTNPKFPPTGFHAVIHKSLELKYLNLTTFKFIKQAIDKGIIDKYNYVDKCFIGHTTLGRYDHKNKEIILPKTIYGVTNMDTGGGYMGNISIMNIDTNQIFTSDASSTLYDPSEFSSRAS